MNTHNVKTKMQVKPSLEKLAVDLFYLTYEKSNKYRGQRLGQAFYNHFNLHKMNHGPEYHKLYEMHTQEAKKRISELFDMH